MPNENGSQDPPVLTHKYRLLQTLQTAFNEITERAREIQSVRDKDPGDDTELRHFHSIALNEARRLEEVMTTLNKRPTFPLRAVK